MTTISFHFVKKNLRNLQKTLDLWPLKNLNTMSDLTRPDHHAKMYSILQSRITEGLYSTAEEKRNIEAERDMHEREWLRLTEGTPIKALGIDLHPR